MILPLPSLQPEPSFEPSKCLAVLALLPGGLQAPECAPSSWSPLGHPCSLHSSHTALWPLLEPASLQASAHGPPLPRGARRCGRWHTETSPTPGSVGRVRVGTGRFSSSLGAALTQGALLRSPPPGGAAALAWIGIASDSGVALAAPLLPVGCTE